MTAVVIDLVSQERVDEAWVALCRHNRRLLDEPELICDREFVQEQSRLHRRFQRLFNAMDERT